MKKIIFLTTSFPISSNSQSGIFIKNLTDHISEHAYIDVVTPANDVHSGTSVISNKINLHTFNYLPGKLQLLSHKPGGIPVALKNNKLLYLTVPFMLIGMLLKTISLSNNAQAIHANCTITAAIAGIVSKFRKIPLVTTLRGEDITRANNSFIYKQLLNITVFFSDHVVAVSQSITDQLRENYPGSNIHFIPNGVSNEFSKTFSDRLYSDKKVYHIVSVGSLIPRKGFDQIIKALCKLKHAENICLDIIGDGPEKENLIALANNLNLASCVNFIPSCPPSLVANHLENSDVFIISSHSEGRPNVVLEAMASGLPIIATNIPGNNELINHLDTGLLFEDDDIRSLSQFIDALISSEETRENLGRRAHEYIINNKLTWAACANNYQKLYKN